MRDTRKGNAKIKKDAHEVTITTRSNSKLAKGYRKVCPEELRDYRARNHADTPVYDSPIPMPPIEPEKEGQGS